MSGPQPPVTHVIAAGDATPVPIHDESISMLIREHAPEIGPHTLVLGPDGSSRPLASMPHRVPFEDLFRNAVDALNRGDPNAAVRDCLAILQYDPEESRPESAGAHLLLGIVCHDLEPAQAAEHYRRAELSSTVIGLYAMTNGAELQAVALRDPYAAVETLDRALDRDPEFVPALLGRQALTEALIGHGGPNAAATALTLRERLKALRARLKKAKPSAYRLLHGKSILDVGFFRLIDRRTLTAVMDFVAVPVSETGRTAAEYHLAEARGALENGRYAAAADHAARTARLYPPLSAEARRLVDRAERAERAADECRSAEAVSDRRRRLEDAIDRRDWPAAWEQIAWLRITVPEEEVAATTRRLREGIAREAIRAAESATEETVRVVLLERARFFDPRREATIGELIDAIRAKPHLAAALDAGLRAGDVETAEAERKLAVRHAPKHEETRFVGKLMQILRKLTTKRDNVSSP